MHAKASRVPSISIVVCTHVTNKGMDRLRVIIIVSCLINTRHEEIVEVLTERRVNIGVSARGVAVVAAFHCGVLFAAIPYSSGVVCKSIGLGT